MRVFFNTLSFIEQDVAEIYNHEVMIITLLMKEEIEAVTLIVRIRRKNFSER